MEKLKLVWEKLGQYRWAIIAGAAVLLFVAISTIVVNSRTKTITLSDNTKSDTATTEAKEKADADAAAKEKADAEAAAKKEDDAKLEAEIAERQKAIADAEAKAAAEMNTKQSEADLLAEAEKWLDVIAWCDDWSSTYHDDYGDIANGLTTIEKARKQYYQPMLNALAKIGGSVDDLDMEVALEGTDFYKQAYGKTYYHTCWLKNKELNDVARKNNLW